MSFEEFNDWDAIFLEQAIRVEEEIIAKSSRNPTQPPPRRHQQPPVLASDSIYGQGFSPPRELTQNWFTDCNLSTQTANGNVESLQRPEGEEAEIDRLKRELGRVSEQLRQLEQECVDLKRERDNKKEEQYKSVVSQIDARDNGSHSLDNAHAEYEAVVKDGHHVSPHFQTESTSIDKAKDNYRTSRVRGRTPERLGHNAMNVFEERGNHSYDHQPGESYGPGRRNAQIDSLSVTTDMRRRVLIDSALSTSSERPIQKAILPEGTTQPRYSKAIGVQTDAYEEFGKFSTKNNLHSQHDLSNKLHAIWGPRSSQLSGRDLVSKLFVTCATDFYALSRCISTITPSPLTLDFLQDESLSYMASHDHSVEAAKVSQLFLILTKMSNEMVQLDILFDALLDLCTLKNVVVVHRSLCIVHAILQGVLCLEIKSSRRDYVTVQVMCPENDDVDEKLDPAVHVGATMRLTSLLDNSSSTKRYFHVENQCNKEHKKPGDFTLVSALNWVPLFETMCRIAVRYKEEPIQVEAISIMNLILMRSNPSLEREQFWSLSVFESLSQLLQDTGLCVQLQAVHLLFLLLNCPRILMLFCSSCEKNIESAGSAVDDTKDASTLQVFNSILDGLAGCIKCRGHGAQELKLHRRAIIVLAFIASSGKSGFEILLKPRIPKFINFLGLIMQALASEIDAEPSGSAEPSEIIKERTSLIREALILLNRLISSPMYSAAALGALTSSRDMTSLTVDVANWMSKKGRRGWKLDTRKKSKIESDIDDLACVFRSRISTYLGANIS